MADLGVFNNSWGKQVGGRGHKVRIGVINCYCTLGAGRQDQRKGPLWHVMSGEIYFLYLFASTSMASVSLLTFGTFLELCEIFVIKKIIIQKKKKPCVISNETPWNPIALHEPEMELTAKWTTTKPSVLCGAYISKRYELLQIYCKAQGSYWWYVCMCVHECGQAVNNRPQDVFPPSHCMIESICLHAQYVTSDPVNRS